MSATANPVKSLWLGATAAVLLSGQDMPVQLPSK